MTDEHRRRSSGDETWFRLREWAKDSKASERLAGHVLRAEGFTSIDPSHPLGGPDGLKDIICETSDGTKWIAACYFPRGQHSFTEIKKKYAGDLEGIAKNQVDALAFVTNQELSLGEREELKKLAGGRTHAHQKSIIHLERIANLLDTAPLLCVRLEYLDIEMNKEEILSTFAALSTLFSEQISALKDKMAQIVAGIDEIGEVKSQFENDPAYSSNRTLADKLSVPLEELRQFRRELEQMTNASQFSTYGLSGSYAAASPYLLLDGPGLLSRLHVPLQEIKEFKRILLEIAADPHFTNSFTGITDIHSASLLGEGLVGRLSVPLEAIKEFRRVLESVVGSAPGSGTYLTLGNIGYGNEGPINRLRVPLSELKEYEATLDRVIEKQRKINGTS